MSVICFSFKNRNVSPTRRAAPSYAATCRRANIFDMVGQDAASRLFCHLTKITRAIWALVVRSCIPHVCAGGRELPFLMQHYGVSQLYIAAESRQLALVQLLSACLARSFLCIHPLAVLPELVVFQDVRQFVDTPPHSRRRHTCPIGDSV